MNPSKLATEISASDFETESRRLSIDSKLRTLRIVDASILIITAIATLAGVAVLSLAADNLKVYHATYLPPEFLLSLWPEEVDLRPTEALIGAGAVAVVVNLVALAASKLGAIRNRPHVLTSTTLAAPLIVFLAATVAVGLSYAARNNQIGDYTIHGWTCHWRRVPMQVSPHFGTLCMQGDVALGLAVMLVPLEAVAVGVAGYAAFLRGRVGAIVRQGEEPKGSPALS